MRNILENLKDEIVVFAAFFVLSFYFLIDIVSGYLNYSGLDLQEFLLWHYASLNSLFPYKDFFYPYGLARFYRDLNFTTIAFFYLIAPLLFTFLFSIFKRTFKSKYYSYVSIFAIFLFVLIFTGFEAFARYGILTVFSLIVSYYFYKSKNVSTLALFLLGFASGLILSFFNDIGSYAVLSLSFLYIIKVISENKKKNFFEFKIYIDLIKKNFLIFVGVLFGLVPLFVYLFLINALGGFLEYFKVVKDISIVAKVPFFSYITSPANVFTFSVIFLAIFFLIYKFYALKEKLSLLSFFQISLLLNLLVLEQKSIIRSIDLQITFISFILFVFLIFDFSKYIKLNKKIIFLSILFLVFVFFKFNTSPNYKYNLANFSISVNSLINNSVFADNYSKILKSDGSFRKISDFLLDQPKFNGKIFSFPPGDAIFYVLLNNKPPFYNAIFESSASKSQKDSIEYIKNNKVEYVILDTDPSAIQDGVPDYIRTPIVFKFILNNFYPFKIEGKYLILKKGSNKDFFTSSLLDKIPMFRDYLLNVYLNKIPYSEGMYKSSVLGNGRDINIKDFENLNLSSKNIIIAITSKIEINPNNLLNIAFTTSDKKKSAAFFNPCKKDMSCIINLSNLPLFYKNKVITNISFDNKFNNKIKVYDINEKLNLW